MYEKQCAMHTLYDMIALGKLEVEKFQGGGVEILLEGVAIFFGIG